MDTIEEGKCRDHEMEGMANNIVMIANARTTSRALGSFDLNHTL